MNVPAVAELIVAGFQVPAILFVDVAGKVGLVAPTQRSAIGSNVGVTGVITVTVILLPTPTVQRFRCWWR